MEHLKWMNFISVNIQLVGTGQWTYNEDSSNLNQPPALEYKSAAEDLPLKENDSIGELTHCKYLNYITLIRLQIGIQWCKSSTTRPFRVYLNQ